MPQQKQSFVEKYVAKKLKEHNPSVGDLNLEKLSVLEKSALRSISLKSLTFSASVGAFAVIVLYLPLYLFPELFPDTQVWFPLVNEYYLFPLYFTIYSLFLLVVEIIILTLINAKAVREIAHACNYPNPNDQHYESDINALVAVGLDRQIKDQSLLGINPYAGLAKWKMYAYTAVNLMKAALTNFIFKLLVKRLLGRFALRLVMDLSGIPVYAFWNAWATNNIIRQTRVKVMASPIIKRVVKELSDELKTNAEFKNELYNMLDFMAVSKRSFHYNHYLFSLLLLQEFDVKINPERSYDPKFIQRVLEGDKNVQKGFEKVITVGMILDGQLSNREKRVVAKLNQLKLVTLSEGELQSLAASFYKGEGI